MAEKSMFVKKIHCDKNSPNYNLFLGFFLGLIESCLSAVSKGEHSFSRQIYSSVFESNFPDTEGSTLNNIDFTKVFQGPLAEETTLLYKDMLETWMELQKDGIPGQEEYRMADSTFREKLTSFHNRLLNPVA